MEISGRETRCSGAGAFWIPPFRFYEKYVSCALILTRIETCKRMAVTGGIFDGLMLLLLGEKVAQTELDEKEYSLLMEAVQQGVSSQIPVSEDPRFKVRPVKTGVETDASQLDRRLYGEREGRRSSSTPR